jgi:kynureninase
MDTSAWVPGRGAAAMQLSNPSVLCTTALCASLEIFHEAGGMGVLRAKSETLTGFLYTLLESVRRGRRRRGGANAGAGTLPFDVMTPADPGMRGAQLSILLQPGLLDGVVAALQARGVCVDERRPDVIRVAPAPLYNSFGDCCDFADALDGALAAAGWTGEGDGDGEQVLLRCKL